jgi:hypothetical protein
MWLEPLDEVRALAVAPAVIMSQVVVSAQARWLRIRGVCPVPFGQFLGLLRSLNIDPSMSSVTAGQPRSAELGDLQSSSVTRRTVARRSANAPPPGPPCS